LNFHRASTYTRPVFKTPALISVSLENLEIGYDESGAGEEFRTIAEEICDLMLNLLVARSREEGLSEGPHFERGI
jgi:hypothetical protein